MPEQIFIGQDYHLMFSIYPWAGEEEAVLAPARCETLPQKNQHLALWIIHFSVLDADMEPLEGHEKLWLYSDGQLALTKEFKAEDPTISGGYVKHYSDGLDNLVAALDEDISLQKA